MNDNIRILIFLLCLAAPSSAMAQRCTAPYEAITTLEEAYFGVPNVWDAEYGQEGKKVELLATLPRESLSVISVGRILSEDTLKTENIVLVELNYRGRALLEKSYAAKKDEKPNAIIKSGENYVVSSNYTEGSRRQARLSWYNNDAAYKKEVILKDSAWHYDLTALVRTGVGQNFAVLLRAENVKNESDTHSVLMMYDSNGTVLRKRSYNPGSSNVLYNIIPIKDGHFLATGATEADGGGMAGWAIELDKDGGIIWQRVYRRGANSALIGAVVTPINSSAPKGYVLLGRSLPLDDGELATWVMSIDAAGAPIWQHYFRYDDYKIVPKAMTVRDDGRLTVLVNAETVGDDMTKADLEKMSNAPADHIRLLTLSPRGALIIDEQYITGIQASANDYAEGIKGARIVTTSALIVPTPPAKQDIIGSGLFNLKDPSTAGDADSATGDSANTVEAAPEMRGWIFLGTPLRAYDDPCQAE